MNSDHYLPRVLEDDSQPEITLASDASKWVSVHDALEPTVVGSRSGTGSLFTVAWVLGLTLGFVWVWRNGRTVFQQWQENVHRRANRRRHGIPDDDDRPFNVAYAAAALARKQREEQQHTAIPQTSQRRPLQSGTGSQRHGGSVGLRQRSLHTDFSSASSSPKTQTMFLQRNSTIAPSIPSGEFMERSSGHSTSRVPAVEAQGLSEPYNPDSGRDLNKNDAQPAVQGPRSWSSSVDANSRKLSDDTEGDHLLPERRKHHHVDNDDNAEDRTSKRTRVDGEAFIDGDNDAPWMPGGSRRSSLQVPKRGSKRHANHEDEGDWEMSQDKRARKGSLAVPESDAMDGDDVDMAHESSDADLQPTRGTKRERDDPDFIDEPAENPDDLHRSQPLRKRRADGRGQVNESSSRGRKRDRSPERLASSDNGGESDAGAARRKRGRRHKEREEDGAIGSADASESDDILDFTEDPACGGRKVGEVWEVNGQSFKVGLDGRRLRHALVKQQRNKFPMPKDSAHNDARTNVDVVVEKWLNDEEYKVAKERLELAWQDPSPTNTPIKAEATIEDEHSSSAGKRLLWGGPPPSPVKGRASISSSSIQNPFDLAPSNVGRRVASAHLLMNNPGDSPKLRSSKSFSKWEKQDMEANSLKKMRARLEKEKEKKEKEQQEKEREKEKARSFLQPAAASTPLAPTTNKPTQEIKPTSAPVAATTDTQGTKGMTPAAPSPFGKPPSGTSTAPSPFAKPSSDTSATPSPFAKPPSDTSATPSPFVKPPSNSSTTSSLFAKPPSDSNAGSIPNFFAKPATTTTTSLSHTTQPSTSSLFPTSIQAATSSPGKTMPTAAKPSLTFAPPPTSSLTPSEADKGVTSKPSFSFVPTSSTPSSAVATGDSKPTFSFSTPPAQANISDPSKAHAFNFANPQTTSITSSGQGNSLTSNSFSKPTSQPVSTPFAPSGNSPFSFNQSSQSPKIATQTTPTFQFGIPDTQNNNSGASSGTTSSSGSLLNRLGPVPAASEPSKATITTQNAWSSPFGGPVSSVTSTNPPTSIFGQSKLQSQQGTSNLSESANKPSPFTPSGQSKNVFGQPSSTSVATPPAFSFAKPPAISDASKTTISSVFGKPGSQSDTSSSQPAAPSVFGKPPGQAEALMPTTATPVFGKPSGQSGASGTRPPAFSIFGKPTGLSEASQPAAPSIFEKPSGQSDAPASQPTPSSVFSNSIGQSEVSKATPASPSIFGNSGSQPEASASQPKPAFSFSFGNNSISTSTSTPNANLFNPAQTPSQGPSTDAPAAQNNFFGFGQSSSTTTSGTNAFGFSNKPTEGDKK